MVEVQQVPNIPVKHRTKEDTQFKPGNPGRPKGIRSESGRTKLVRAIDGIFSSPHYRKVLAKWIRAEIQRDPRYAWEKIIMPLLPKDVRLDVNATGMPSWIVNVFSGDNGGNQPDAKAVEGVARLSGESSPS